MEQIYNIFDLGFSKLLTRETPLGFPQEQDLGLASSMSSIFNESSPGGIGSGEFIGNLVIKDGYLQSSNYVAGASGWQLTPISAQLPNLTIVGGNIKYGKTSFTDSVNAGYYMGSEGIYFGAAADASYLKYTISTATFGVKAALITLTGSSIDGQYLGNLSVATGALANLAVTADKIANLTITATQIANTTITATQIANATITSTQISGTAGITGSQIASATITGGNIASATITGENIGATTITAGNIANTTITGTQIAATTIMAGNMANGTITTTQISATAGIVGGQIASGTITGGNIDSTTITASNITNLTITATQIANLTITSNKTNTALMSYSHNIVFSLASDVQVNWEAGTLTTSDGTSYSISAGNTDTMSAKNYIYLDTAVSTTALQKTTTFSTAVGDGKMLIAVAQNNPTEAVFQVFNGIGGTNLAGGNIVAGSITANEIAADTITASQIAALTITASQIAAGTITADKITVSSLSALNADLGTITAGTITMPSTGWIKGGQTDYNTGIGFFLGYSTDAYKFSIGDPVSDYFLYDGTSIKLYSNTADGFTLDYGSNMLLKEGGNIKFTSITAPTACTATLITTDGNLDIGNYTYKVTYVNATGETELGTISNTVTTDANNKQVALSAIPISTSGAVIQRKIYRTKANTGLHYLLTTINNNTVTTYTDNTADASLDIIFGDYKGNTTFGKIIVDGNVCMSIAGTIVFVGINAGFNNFGYQNIFIGCSAGYNNTIGYMNIFMGIHSGYENTEGYNNVYIGIESGFRNIEGCGNICIGKAAGYFNATGNDNTSVGCWAGAKITTGNNNTFLGVLAGYHASQKVNAVNSMALGANTYTTANNQVVIGNADITQTLIRGIINITTKTPANATAAGTAGDICWDASYLYCCVATNSWKRVAIAAW